MRYRESRPDAPPVIASERELWERLSYFLKELVPVAEEAGVTLAAHPDDPPAQALRGAARLVKAPGDYDRLLSIMPSPTNALEFCLGSLQEMPGTDIYEVTRTYALRKKIAYVHFETSRTRTNFYEDFL
jgi:mannonate dehydratase